MFWQITTHTCVNATLHRETFVTKKHKDSRFHFDSSNVQSSYRQPKWAVYHFIHVDTYTWKMTVGMKLKQQNTIEVFPPQEDFCLLGMNLFVCVHILLFA